MDSTDHAVSPKVTKYFSFSNSFTDFTYSYDSPNYKTIKNKHA
jgi:hypothetical protein